MSTNSISFDVEIKNYRCFADEKPVHISMGRGFTALVGVNNSGKSSLLRLFYELRNLFYEISRSNDNFIQALQAVSGINFTPADSVGDNAELFCNANSRDITLKFKANYALNGEYRGGASPEHIVLTILRDTNTYRAEIYVDGKTLDANSEPTIRREGNSALRSNSELIDMEAYYRIFEALSRTIYIGAFRNAINVGGSKKYYDMKVGEQFIKSWDSLKAGGAKKQISAALKLTRDIKSIFRFSNLEINAADDNRTLQVIVDEKPYRLEELGSGVAQFIVILGNIAAAEPSWILIDEPELNLHASLQLDFLTTLAAYATEGIMFATHNIGLARACAERIYSFQLNDKGQSEVQDIESMSGLPEFLGELGFSTFRELGFDKVLLVEGSTDVKTFQQFLRLYKKDHEVVILPLGGSNMINGGRQYELSEIKRITDNIFAVIDSERSSANEPLTPEREAFVSACKGLGINCHALEKRATENYLSGRAVKSFKGNAYKALLPYQKLRDVSPYWQKEENWRIAREMTYEELDQTDLGKFLNNI